jgi:hypothetical protein
VYFVLQLPRVITVDNIWECLRTLRDIFPRAEIKQDITHLLRRFNDLTPKDHPLAGKMHQTYLLSLVTRTETVLAGSWISFGRVLKPGWQPEGF